MDTANLVEIFCLFDEFCKIFEPELKKHLVEVPGKKRRNRKNCMSDAEIMVSIRKTTPIYYSYSDYHFMLELIAAVIFCTYMLYGSILHHAVLSL